MEYIAHTEVVFAEKRVLCPFHEHAAPGEAGEVAAEKGVIYILFEVEPRVEARYIGRHLAGHEMERMYVVHERVAPGYEAAAKEEYARFVPALEYVPGRVAEYSPMPAPAIAALFPELAPHV